MYLSADELLELERARLALRAQGIGVDRGRLVREAIALLITDLETGVDASAVARRLRPVKPGPADGAPVSGTWVSGAPAGGAWVNGGPVNGAPAGSQ